ncbi:Alpha,alpha-trehalose-phosphate synthase [UDP-forming] 1 [Sesamum angolense]|uniref:Alpha,alpha-trehalose-phosphate synthase [UDP-forming] 1 n=1 Tax=Sesamum angolense TaxID=2727404 RepID=A0AAE1WTN2_9LAMI|nr:Alpha,alpha-trehalose-phosphate synthase [UDP-forming] 1 [Sesamum angolense]
MMYHCGGGVESGDFLRGCSAQTSDDGCGKIGEVRPSKVDVVAKVRCLLEGDLPLRHGDSRFPFAVKESEPMFVHVVSGFYREGDVVCGSTSLMTCACDIRLRDILRWILNLCIVVLMVLPSDFNMFAAFLVDGTVVGLKDDGLESNYAFVPANLHVFLCALSLKVMLGVDRLDMIKGIPQKILAFEKFLEESIWRDKVVLVQIAVSNRTDVPEYQKLSSQVHEIVGRINGRFGTLNVPIHHLDRSLDFHALCALYAVTDVALVTSLRDGMNLVSYEFVACQDSKKGVLILSEFAGAAQSLGAGAILVNPWNITEVAASIGYALTMRADEREKRHRHNFTHVTTHTSQEWAETFVSELNDTVVEAQLRTRQIPPLLPKREAVDHYLQSNNRLLILGFNATLTKPADT